MKKYFILAFSLFIIGFACLAQAQLPLTHGGKGVSSVASSFTFRDQQMKDDASNVETYMVDLGTAAIDRVVVIHTCVQTGVSITTLKANSVTLTQDVLVNSANIAAVFSGVVALGSGSLPIELTTATGAFIERDVTVWTATGLSSNLVKQTGSNTSGASLSINVTAGDFMVAGTCVFGTKTYNGSTETPTTNRTVGSFSSTADWLPVSATNAAFSVTASGVAIGVGATYK